MNPKSTVEEIRARFDTDVERFSNLDTGQASSIDAPLNMDLITRAAGTMTPHAKDVMDIGCGAGNYTLKFLQVVPNCNCTLIDLSQPMLDRARERVGAVTSGQITCIQADVRELDLGRERVDVIMGAAVFHHLRTDEEWEQVFRQCFDALRPGGSFWISDLIEHSIPAVQSLMWERYGDYLTGLKDEAYRDHVFNYIAQEDTPRPLMFQIDMLRKVGFREVEILHKNSVFAAFGGVK
ncbi:class I SAM-dependent methyltransferase [Deinococcus cellulosilyticus]|uniref:Methyltransferase type 12 n=1 Tax=Deinococcus cellulosilyticus (strain DSM 18568 / NBRC 106333 / KACC 11606 / 5516J-15) TaxID=1223518 RepID=A0A511N3I3_DEIC1|nr:class I SAM-dependent methyltransferase [Deinococcus cellulosilyticus]GEM47420.1 methyltransferase type 12 [Deinococcus cellulosilyticus NBRC 106333 = KACC 11606]